MEVEGQVLAATNRIFYMQPGRQAHCQVSLPYSRTHPAFRSNLKSLEHFMAAPNMAIPQYSPCFCCPQTPELQGQVAIIS